MDHIDEMCERYKELSVCKNDVRLLSDAIKSMYALKGKLLLCGNGGSAADCEHISGELLKGFLSKRPLKNGELDIDEQTLSKLQKGIAAIPLTSLTASLSAFANDVDPELCYAQLVLALGRKEDVFLGISTSGNSKNVVAAAKTAKALGLKTAALTGKDGGALAEICDITIKVPEKETFKVQEYHLPVYHAVCAQVEYEIFGGNK